MANDQLFRRTFKLTAYTTSTPTDAENFKVDIKDQFDTILIEDGEIEFTIERNLKRSSNQCSIKLVNLSEASRTAFKELDLYIVLEAGYEDNVAVLFSGDLTYALSEQDGTEWITHLEVADGDRLLASARVAKSYRAGTTMRTILSDVYKSVGQTVPDNVLTDPTFDKAFARGYSAFGEMKNVLTTLLKSVGMTWSVQDGQIQILSPESTTNRIFVLGKDQAMIGTPEFGQPPRTTKRGKKKAPTVTVKSLLYPQLRPGAIVDLQSRGVSGRFKLLSVKHTGKYMGGDWVTEVEINPLAEVNDRTNQLGGNANRNAQR